MKLNHDFLHSIRDAMTLLRTHGPAKATEAIQRALHGEVADSQNKSAPQARPHNAASPSPAVSKDGVQFAVDGSDGYVDVEDLGHISTHTFANAAGRRQYRLYVPPGAGGESLPLIVMLHGCTQDADDFAAGTQMNALAASHRCLVAYPIQPQQANASKCWNWFKPEDQRRESGEPSLIAGITREIMVTHRVDPARVYVAGLSAGGAMAAIMIDVYPELYAAAGVHSGLPARSAHDLPSALAAMRGGRRHVSNHHAGSHATLPRRPMIVFHGDADTTVNIANATGIVEGFNTRSDSGSDTHRHATSSRTFTVDRLVSNEGVDAEQWTIHGAPHAWSGGNARGSYTDPKGPDASAEMVRFFLDHPMKA